MVTDAGHDAAEVVQVLAGQGVEQQAAGDLMWPGMTCPRRARPLSVMVREALGATGAAEAVDAARLYVVTASLTPQLAARLLALRSTRRDVAVVWVDAPSFASVRSTARLAAPR